MRQSVDVGTGGAVRALLCLFFKLWYQLTTLNLTSHVLTNIKTNTSHDLLYLVNKSQQQARGASYWLQPVTVGIIL